MKSELLSSTTLPRRMHVHKLVLETAEQMATAAYESLMKVNAFHEEWKRKFPLHSAEGRCREFLRLYAFSYIPSARSTLAQMLAGPYNESLKSEIADALMMDHDLLRGRGPGPYERRKAEAEKVKSPSEGTA